MAENVNLKLPYVLRRNTSSNPRMSGKYYGRVWKKGLLDTKGLAHHMVEHGLVRNEGRVYSVLSKLTECIPELLSQGVPVQLEPLGTFYPSAKVKDPLTSLADFEGADPNDVVKGIHIRFLPYGVEDENITSRRFKEDYCTLQWAYLVEKREVELDGKTVSVQDKTPWATVIADYKKSQEG